MEKAYILQNKGQAKEKDKYNIFGELVAKRLRTMELYERDYTMHAIENLMYQAKMRFPQSYQQHSHIQLNMSTVPYSNQSTVTSNLSTVPYSNSSSVASLVSNSTSDIESARDYYESFEKL